MTPLTALLLLERAQGTSFVIAPGQQRPRLAVNGSPVHGRGTSPPVAGRAPIAVVGAGVKAPGGTTVDELWASLCAARSTAAPYHDERFGRGAPPPRLQGRGLRPGGLPDPGRVPPDGPLAPAGHRRRAGRHRRRRRRAAARQRSAARSSAVSATASPRSSSSRSPRSSTAGCAGISPLAIPMAMPSSVDAHLSLRFGFAGPCLTVSTACASGADAIGEGVELLRRGAADLVLAGGVDALLTYTIVSLFLRMEVMSVNVERPERASTAVRRRPRRVRDGRGRRLRGAAAGRGRRGGRSGGPRV